MLMKTHVVFLSLVGEKNNDCLRSPHFKLTDSDLTLDFFRKVS